VSEIKNHDLEHESNIKRLSVCIGLWLFVPNQSANQKSCWHHNQSFDGELNPPNLIANELILTNMQKIAPI
jgi:hypothetical protein